MQNFIPCLKCLKRVYRQNEKNTFPDKAHFIQDEKTHLKYGKGQGLLMDEGYKLLDQIYNISAVYDAHTHTVAWIFDILIF